MDGRLQQLIGLPAARRQRRQRRRRLVGAGVLGALAGVIGALGAALARRARMRPAARAVGVAQADGVQRLAVESVERRLPGARLRRRRTAASTPPVAVHHLRFAFICIMTLLAAPHFIISTF